MASNCPNEGCGKVAVESTNGKACNATTVGRQDRHLARDCPNHPICNLCNVTGHVAKQYPKANECRNCQQFGHLSRDCMGPFMNIIGKIEKLSSYVQSLVVIKREI
ncbi:hypothetical protein Lal_00001648 [Lupinus albus]|uniref:Putative transcription factor interactor and regulator CCHC(Zn) family n=1 Tax=Lupinus albus TaxID=3870 RepID=A0A6A5P6U5_LUPAL|nr:putative transcription factor interactor and regulator CCHC(Zn) family [Lupinus albus]KAF1893207.1 hypothetical protein Lal_00001648 [Lupinus albus]